MYSYRDWEQSLFFKEKICPNFNKYDLAFLRIIQNVSFWECKLGI